MKKKIFKRGMAGLLAVLTAFTTLIGMGTTAFAASETAESYMVSYPRDGDAVQVYDQSTWGHSAKTYMNGWSTQSSNVTTIHCMDSYDGKICYCIEPGVPRNVGDSYSGLGENFWDNYPSQYNNTIEPDDIKVLLGRIMQYGYQGNISTSWKSQNAADADKMAHAIATQLLVWETVIGERDADFNHVSTGGKDAVKSVISSGHPLKSRIDSYYNSIVSSVQSHVEYGEARTEFRRNEKKHQMRAIRSVDSFNFEDGEMECFHPELIGESVEDSFIQGHLIAELHDAINQLSEPQKRRIVKYFFLNHSMRSIAEEEHVDHKAVSNSIEFGLKKIKKFLESDSPNGLSQWE